MAARQTKQRVAKADVPFLRAARAAQVADSHPFAGSSLLLLVFFLLAALLWADHAALDEVTRGQGAVVPSSREQVIQSLEGGILAELAVREGDVVEKGQILLRIDDTRSGASLREGEVKSHSLRAEIARLQAEAAGTTPRFPSDIEPAIIERERKNFVSRQTAVEDSAASLKRNLELAEKELAMTQPMVARGAVSEVEVLRLQRQIIELKGQIQDRRNSFKAEARGKQAEKEAELGGVTELLTARKDEVQRSLVRSPMRGTVKNIKVTTVGGVIGPGQDIMEIVPVEDRLLIEAKIRPADVAFLHAGQKATVKLTAYDYTIYGSLHGHLEHISADTLADENPPHERFYRVYVRTDTAVLNGKKGPLPVIPGMVATVEVLTGHKTVLEYLLKPVLKTRDNALHER
ncbi:MAG: HlyD family type I secretion periplasmic adaptor subunit [Gammaproteobacteria bacterium]|nr:HlyD family type I secretion periplasmic adaptor subunit [Gammaproteobacteria bacterium]